MNGRSNHIGFELNKLLYISTDLTGVLKCRSPQQTFPLYLFSEMDLNIFCSFYNPFFKKLLVNFYSLSGHSLIYDRAIKGNGFNAGLMSEITLHRCFQRTITMQSSF